MPVLALGFILGLVITKSVRKLTQLFLKEEDEASRDEEITPGPSGGVVQQRPPDPTTINNHVQQRHQSSFTFSLNVGLSTNTGQPITLD